MKASFSHSPTFLILDFTLEGSTKMITLLLNTSLWPLGYVTLIIFILQPNACLQTRRIKGERDGAACNTAAVTSFVALLTIVIPERCFGQKVRKLTTSNFQSFYIIHFFLVKSGILQAARRYKRPEKLRVLLLKSSWDNAENVWRHITAYYPPLNSY